MKCLIKDRDEPPRLYGFPSGHWVRIGTRNPTESAFTTVELRSNRSRNCGSRDTTRR